MKKAVYFLIFLLCFSMCGCTKNADIGITGGVDGPKEIYTDGSTEREPVKMVMIDGSLYYETGEDNDMNGRCGTLDGELKGTADRFEIPTQNNTANFNSAKGYQLGMTENTIEIPIGDDWEIFKKLDTNSDISKYKYCYVLEGRMNNARSDSELLVLANDMNITFDDAVYVMVGSDISKMKDIYVWPID